jgi:MFS family permease
MLLRSARRIFALMTFMFWSSLYVYLPVLGPQAERLGASLSLVGLIISSYGFAQLWLRVPLGVWSDRIGRRKPFIMFAFVIAAFSGFGLWCAGDARYMLIYRGLGGVAASAWVVFTVLFCSYFPPDKGSQAIGLITAITFSAEMASTLAGGFLADKYGWGAPFFCSGLLALVGLVLSTMVKEKPQPQSAISLVEMASMGKNKRLLSVSLIAVLSQYVVFVTLYGFTPVYAARLGATAMQLGFLSATAFVAMAAASLIGGALWAEKFGEARVVIGGLLVVSCCSILIPLIDNLQFLYVIQALSGFGRGLILPSLMSMSIQGVPDARKGTAMGFFQATYALGMFGGPALSGMMSELIGLRGIFFCTGGIGLVTALAAQRLLRSPMEAGIEEWI